MSKGGTMSYLVTSLLHDIADELPGSGFCMVIGRVSYLVHESQLGIGLWPTDPDGNRQWP